MATLTLDDIRESVEREFVSTKIQVGDVEVVMTNPIRMDKAARARLSASLKETVADDDDENKLDATFERMLGIIKAAIPDKTQANVLLKAIGDDMAIAMKILDAYMEEQKPGEASGSQD